MQELLDRLAKVELSTEGAFCTAQALNNRLQKLDGQVSCPLLTIHAKDPTAWT